MKETFRPHQHKQPKGFLGKIRYFIRLLADFQFLTIFLDLKKEITGWKGEVLDVGCGEEPYKFLLSKDQTVYQGIDTNEAYKFDYVNHLVIHFDGRKIPFEDERFDGIMCTEVLEHVYDYQQLVDEIFRVMKIGSKGIFTIPWSARNHYIPNDYFRYTPSTILRIFKCFNKIQISPRGTDLTSICAKILVVFIRNINPGLIWRFVFLPLWLALSPLLFITLLIGHLSLLFGIGSNDDPLGYTILVEK